MTELSVLERVRAAVAEAGYDPSAIESDFTPGGFCWYRNRIPRDVVWRAREAVEVKRPRCFQCWLAAVERGAGSLAEGCLAGRRFVADCGRERVEP